MSTDRDVKGWAGDFGRDSGEWPPHAEVAERLDSLAHDPGRDTRELSPTLGSSTLGDKARSLCYLIERLPAGAEQTAVSVAAAALCRSVERAEAERDAAGAALCDAMPPVLGAKDRSLADLVAQIIVERDSFRGAVAAQDEREREAGERCGVSAAENGCDWPDALADVVVDLRLQRDEAMAAEAAVRRQLAGVEARYRDALTVLRWARPEIGVVGGGATRCLRAHPPRLGGQAMTEHQAAATEPEPLRVRVARALGWEWCTLSGHSYLLPRASADAFCRPGSLWRRGRHGVLSIKFTLGLEDVAVPPYGEDTPEGWACTGQFFARFRLSVEERAFGVSVWSERDGRETACSRLDRCRGAAEWVAEHGAAVLAEMKKA